MDENIVEDYSAFSTRECCQKAVNFFLEKLNIDGYTDVVEGLDGDRVGILNGLGVKPKITKAKHTISELEQIFAKHEQLLVSRLADAATQMITAKAIMYLLVNINEVKDGKPKYQKQDFAKILCYLLDQKNEEYSFQDDIIFKKSEIELVKIDSIQNFLDTDVFNNVNNKTIFYRGHSKINYTNEPSIFRGEYYKQEFKMYQQLLVHCQEYFKDCESHFEFLKKMQHYGLPTRLLDLTENPLVALYFACEENDATGEIIAYNIEEEKIKYEKSDVISIISSLPLFSFESQLQIYENREKFKEPDDEQQDIVKRFYNEIRREKPAFTNRIEAKDLINPVFIYPRRDNKRIYNQKGTFVVFGLSGKNFDNSKHSLNNYRFKNKDKKIVFYITEKNKILQELQKLGIDKSFIYPEIDDVAEYIKNKYQK